MKLFVPILSNGGLVYPQYMAGFIAAFCHREFAFGLFSDPCSAGVLNRATHAFLGSDCDTIVLVDADVEVTSEAVDKLLSHDDLPLVFGVYFKKELVPAVCLEGLPGETHTRLNAGLAEKKSAGRGFVRIHRSVFEDLDRREEIPVFTNYGFPMKAFWQKGVYEGRMEHEDWNFCRRLRAIGHRVMVDTDAIVAHWGAHPFGVTVSA